MLVDHGAANLAGIPSGRRRWPRGAAAGQDDGAYYTFAEFLEFFGGDWHYAQHVWSQSLDEQEECADSKTAMQAKLRNDIEGQSPMTFQDLLQGGVKVVLQSASGDSLGNSLRMNDEGGADFLGGAGSRAVLIVEVVCAPSLEIQAALVQLRNAAAGAYLRMADGGLGLDFGGRDGEDQALFEVRPLYQSPLVLVARKGVLVGVFLPRSGTEEPRAPWWHAQMMQKAREMAATDPRYAGRRYHPMDRAMTYYTFEQWVEWADEMWLQAACPLVDAAVALAAAHWDAECVREEDIECTDWAMVEQQAMQD